MISNLNIKKLVNSIDEFVHKDSSSNSVIPLHEPDFRNTNSLPYIKDCIEAIIHSLEIKKENINILNLGTNEACTVNDSISWICDEMKCNPSLNYTGGERGWIGDSPFILLDTKKINDTGWKPKLTIEESVRKTVQFFKKNDWLFD